MAKKEPEVYGEWSDRLSLAEKAMAERMQRWDRYYQYYRMDLDSAQSENSTDEIPADSIWVNYQFGISRIILPSIYYRNPDILVEPRTNAADPLRPLKAKVQEELLNYQLREIDFETEARTAIMDALYCGVGAVKLGFAPALRKPLKVADPFTSVLEDMYEGAGEDEWDEGVSQVLPFVLRVSPKFFRIDPLATSGRDARWIAHCVYRPVDALRGDRRYNQRVLAGVQATHALNEDVYKNYSRRASGETATSTQDELVMLYEVWDREHNELLVLDDYNMFQGQKQFLRREPWPYDIDGFPFEFVCFNQDPESFWGVPDAQTWFNPSTALNLINTMQYNHVKRFNRKYVSRKGAFQPEEILKIQQPYDGAIAECNGDVDGAITPLEDARISPDLYMLKDHVRAELTFLTGVTEDRGNRGSAKTKTATEASIIESQARIRDNDRIYIVSMWVQRIARKLLQLDRQFLTSDYVGFVTDPLMAQLWQAQPEEVLKAETEVRVRVGSSAFISREVRAKQYLDFLNLTARLVDPMTGAPVLDVRKVVSRVADALDIPNYQDLLLPPGMVPPMPTQGPPGAPDSGAVPGGGDGISVQSLNRRAGAPNAGNLISGVQNLGVRRTPNPTTELTG